MRIYNLVPTMSINACVCVLAYISLNNHYKLLVTTLLDGGEPHCKSGWGLGIEGNDSRITSFADTQSTVH